MLQSPVYDFEGMQLQAHITSSGGDMLLRVIDAECGEILITFNMFVTYEDFKSRSMGYFDFSKNKAVFRFLLRNNILYPTGQVRSILKKYFGEAYVNKKLFFIGRQ